VSALAQLLNVERNKRDTALQGLDKRFASIQALYDQERAARQQDMTKHLAISQELRKQLEDETVDRETLKDKHEFDIHSVTMKFEELQRHISDVIQDQQNTANKIAEGLQSNVEGAVRQVNRVSADLGTSAFDFRSRIVGMEEKCAALENRISEVSSRQAATVDRISERHERVSQAVESLRREDKENKNQVQSALSMVKNLQATVEETEAASRALILEERQRREEHVRGTHMGMASAQQKAISELEGKISERFERESLEREQNWKTILEETSKRSPKAPSPRRLTSSPQRLFSGTLGPAPTRRSLGSSSVTSWNSPLASPKVMNIASSSYSPPAVVEVRTAQQTSGVASYAPPAAPTQSPPARARSLTLAPAVSCPVLPSPASPQPQPPNAAPNAAANAAPPAWHYDGNRWCKVT